MTTQEKLEQKIFNLVYQWGRVGIVADHTQMHGDWQKVIDDRITKLESELASLENQLGEKS